MSDEFPVNARGKTVYWSCVAVAWAALTGASTAALWALYRLLDLAPGPFGLLAGVCAGPTLPAALFLGFAYCRRRGIEVDRRTVRTISGPARGDGAALPAPAVADLCERWSPRAIQVVVVTGAAGVLGWHLVASPVSHRDVFDFIPAILSGLFACVSWYAWWKYRNRVARADDRGIHYYPEFRERCLAWERIAVCEVVTSESPLGKTIVMRVKDSNGKLLTYLKLTDTIEGQREPFLSYVDAKLSRRGWWRDEARER